MKNKLFLFIVALIILDQTVKVLVHFNMPLYSEIPLIGDLFKLHYIQNQVWLLVLILFKYTKLILSLFRVGASIFICYYLIYLIKNNSIPFYYMYFNDSGWCCRQCN